MRTMNITLNNLRMRIINLAINNYLVVTKNQQENKKIRANDKYLTKLQERIEDQAVKSFGDFKFNLRDSANITMLVHSFYLTHKAVIASAKPEVSYKIKKSCLDLIDEFSATYADLNPNQKDGWAFRKLFFVFD